MMTFGMAGSKQNSEAELCDCGFPLSDCLELGGNGGSDDNSFGRFGDFASFVFGDAGPSDDEIFEENRVEAIASLGRILETQAMISAVYAGLVADTFGAKN